MLSIHVKFQDQTQLHLQDIHNGKFLVMNPKSSIHEAFEIFVYLNENWVLEALNRLKHTLSYVVLC
jgi:hypothetical protein